MILIICIFFFFFVQLKISDRLSDPYSNCINLENFDSILYTELKRLGYKYEQKTCLKLCYQKEVIKKCSCYDTDYKAIFNDILLNSMPCVTMIDVNCMNGIYNSFNPGICYEQWYIKFIGFIFRNFFS